MRSQNLPPLEIHEQWGTRHFKITQRPRDPGGGKICLYLQFVSENPSQVKGCPILGMWLLRFRSCHSLEHLEGA
jgi:hypothetical protein